MRKNVSGSYTVEMAAIMPVIMLLLICSVTLTFYYYDKCILSGIATEAAIATAENIRMEKEFSMVERNAEQSAKKETIFFGSSNVQIQNNDKQVIVIIHASKGYMKCNVKGLACIGEPEKSIRIYRFIM